MTGVSLSTRGGAHSQRAPVGARLAELARAVERVRRRPAVDVRKALLVSGATAMGLGLLAIVLGWYGAAHSAYLFQEVPYLISGGLLGVALVAGGGFLFFAAWLVRMMADNRRHAVRVEQTLARLDHVLEAVTADAARAAGLAPHTSNGYDADPGYRGHGTPATSGTAGGDQGPRPPERP
jgi:hypothetical protein